MFRSVSRVVVVAIVVFAFILSSVPAFAAPHGGGKAAVNVESGGWFQSAIAWLSQAIFGDQPAKKSKAASSSRKTVDWTGSCVDPLGRCG